MSKAELAEAFGGYAAHARLRQSRILTGLALRFSLVFQAQEDRKKWVPLPTPQPECPDRLSADGRARRPTPVLFGEKFLA